ncbi:poly-beta-1,6 N-acetyl-D-glucosamine export porin PgaA [Billgrantia montanilacus]|uniref:Poly-beta-1,6 N-acetyl-D-glucosamine export porin PgaA n=1 Tax=Billgrantia montanilacus TaxID=2282305 RepID=A0A368U1D1_9GAMM|nr:poly-beta-1,6 N-acetyl-D-glucosamine export porin PgaA [Halomonas montanilacus]RCV90611.1 poly-beta-1,6 N-acetyl-D-glucosamine export porin PgaA [Halomonas montanilacus]
MLRRLDSLWLACLLTCLIAGTAHGQTATDTQRESLVVQARQGALQSAIEGLQTLYHQTRDERVREDLLTLLVRADRYEDALAACPWCQPADYSDAELMHLGGAARNAGDYEQALSLFQALTRRDPSNVEGWLGQALVHTDMGSYTLADITLQQHDQVAGVTAAGLEARGYLAARTADAMQELQVRQALVEQSPDNIGELRALYRLAVGLGASPAARRIMETNPDVFTQNDRLWLTYYEAVTDIRLGIHTEQPERVRSGLMALNAVLQSEEASQELITIAEYDKVVALAELRRFSEAEALATRLERQHGQLPGYVTRARAHALNGLGRPGESIALYEGLIRQNPERGTDPDDPLYEGLFYSYADARRYREADELLTEWLADEPEQRWDFTGTTRIDNPNYQKILSLNILLDAWRGRAGKASERLATYQSQAPADPFLWLLKGDVERGRGWPRQAEEAYTQAEQLLAPYHRDAARHGVLLSRLQRGQWRGTTAEIARELDKARPSTTRDNLEREWREQRAAQLSSSLTRSDGDSSGSQASRDWQYEVLLEGPRNDKGSRPFVQRIGHHGEFNGDSLYAAYTLAGYEWNLYPATLTLSAGQGAQLNDDFLAMAELRYDASDHLSATLGLELNTTSTPLRALRDGVNADRYRGELAYRRDERGSGAMGFMATDFDDGNLRQSLYGYWNQTLYHLDRWQIEGEIRASGSRNDEVEASYFNPRRDTSLGGILSVHYALPLKYRHSFIQTVSLGSGRYWQQDYDSENTWSLGYRHRWDLAPALSIEYGIARERAIYDGVPEYDNIVSASLVWRFL